jgi:hypothetical protein
VSTDKKNTNPLVCLKCNTHMNLAREVKAVITHNVQLNGKRKVEIEPTQQPEINIIETQRTFLVCPRSDCGATRDLPEGLQVREELTSYKKPFPCPRCGSEDVHSWEHTGAIRRVWSFDGDTLDISGTDDHFDGESICLWCSACGFHQAFNPDIDINWV